MKSVTILGSTGSIGRQTLDIIANHPDLYKVDVLTTNSNITLLEEQCKKFKPNAVIIADNDALIRFKEGKKYKGDILSADALNTINYDANTDIVVSALVGIAGLLPTIQAIKSGKRILLANKEVLVVAGKYIMNLAKENKADIIPIDSEHSAIYQCLIGEKQKNINKIILTASGGPFFNLSSQELEQVRLSDALNHPTWYMGKKVTIDSATMMNKGFEVIEAKWLFDIDTSKIDIVIHPQSIIHSMVEFIDGSVKAQLSNPDMRFPISFALACGERNANNYEKIDFNKLKKLDFYSLPDNKFRCLDLAYNCVNKGGNACAILNAANEIAVKEFIKEKIQFTQIPIYIADALNNIAYIDSPTIDELLETDAKTRQYISNLIS
ncbi:MAG: 1-deoxy-D-xylulose-5-phosphate reductoisomerase [Bacteroidetes bacterium]|nr:1-deoxy-D-xylulose-5-phosphate reductoisomerase [Bacteroidota bacterium]